MTFAGLVWKSFRFHARTHVGTMLGAAVATAVLTGALLVGDSVRGSLRAMALQRLGTIGYAAHTGDRLFRAELGRELKGQGIEAATALQLLGAMTTPDGEGRANQVQVTGVTQEFFARAGVKGVETNGLWLNRRLAGHLRVKAGDTVLLRVPRATQISRDAPLSPEEDTVAALRMEVSGVLADEQLGNFSMAASQVPPFNAFLALSLLQDRTSATNKANLLVVSGTERSVEELTRAVEGVFGLEDAQLEVTGGGGTNGAAFTEVRTSRVFLDEAMGKVALSVTPHQPVLTYFVNALRSGTNATPYSMVTAAVAPLVPAEMKDDEVIINQWLAEDLKAKPGGTVALTYYNVGLMRELVEKTNVFKVRAIVPMEGPHADPKLMPDFPGLANSENCRDWDTGFPIDTSAIRDKDEAYWDQYKGTPKAFITLRAGQEIWRNRFGNLTAVRYAGVSEEAVAGRLRENLSPAMAGLTLLPVREQALAASSGATDFGQLFLGFSFFLMGAALILIALLFRFAIEQRRGEVGTLLSLGFEPKQVRRALLLEGVIVAVVGAIVGVLAGMGYAKAMLLGLSTIWRDAIGGSALGYFGNPVSLAIGLVAGVIIASVTIWRVLRKELKRSARELLANVDEEMAGSGSGGWAKWLGIGAVIGSVILTGVAIAGLPNARADLFFGAGALLLVGGLSLSGRVFARLAESRRAAEMSLAGMGLRAITRRRTRSRAVIGLLASGSFLVAAIGAFRLEAGDAVGKRNSGTGGFALIGESALPVVQNLNSAAGREFYNLDAILTNVQFVPFRVLEGDDASCLNLNRAQRPRILGVNPTLLREREAFAFKDVTKEAGEKNWGVLDALLEDGAIPAVADAASIQYALGKKLGDDIIYTDELGGTFKVRLVGSVANSILQGNLLISERHFIERFPSHSGYRSFLMDVPLGMLEEARSALVKGLGDVGMEVVSAEERLAAFNAVQNTYLSTFQVLGGFRLVLGTIGLGVVLLRNVYERRSELALMLAVGFRRGALKWVVLAEHGALLVAGLLLGTVAAGVAVLPAFVTPGREFPAGLIAGLLVLIFVVGLVSAVIAATVALRGELLAALRNE